LDAGLGVAPGAAGLAAAVGVAAGAAGFTAVVGAAVASTGGAGGGVAGVEHAASIIINPINQNER
jgi:hypothetical protein